MRSPPDDPAGSACGTPCLSVRTAGSASWAVVDSLRRRAVEALTDPALAEIVDLVAWPDDGAIVVSNAGGSVRLRPGEPYEVIDGVSPVANQDPMALLPYEAERADPSPANARNAYPHAAERLLSLFADGSRAPDLAVVHT